MQDSQPRQTIEYIWKMGQIASLEQQPVRVIASLKPEMVGKRFGSWTVISTDVQRAGKEIRILCRCACGTEKWLYTQNLLSGKSTMCKGCATRQRHENIGRVIISGASMLRIQKRCSAMKQRCENPNDKAYKNYGARGIQFQFQSVSDAIRYVLEYLPHPTYLNLDLDRMDNDGHYAPGNLRLVTRGENLSNKRTNRYLTFNGMQIPREHVYHVLRTLYPDVKYAPLTVSGLVCRGLTIEQIVDRYHNLPSCKPKGHTTLPTPDLDIASRYLAN